MKKIIIFILFFILILSPKAIADELDSSMSSKDYMDYSRSFEDAHMGQKPVTDEEFQKTIDQLKAKKNKKNKKMRPFKGNDNNNSDPNGFIGETAEKNLVLRVPLALINGDGKEIPIGHYKILTKKEGENLFLDFYQASSLIARVPAIETDNDFNEKELNFVKLLPYDAKRIRVIFGSIDLNAYTFINIKK